MDFSMKINESILRKIVREELVRMHIVEAANISTGTARGTVEGYIEKFLSGEQLKGALAKAKYNLPQITKPIPTSELYLGIKEHLSTDTTSNDASLTNDILAGLISGKKSTMWNGLTDKILGASTGILKFSSDDAKKFVDAVKTLVGHGQEAQQSQTSAEEDFSDAPDLVSHSHGLPGTTRSSAATIPSNGKQRIDDPKPTPGRNYTIKKGDTLSSIAKSAYGNPNSYKTIADANDDLIVDANKIEPGWHIYIPPRA